MTTFGTMVERVANEVARPEVVARIPDEIRSAIAFYQSERLFFKEAEATTPTVAGQQNYAVPLDYLRADYMTYTSEHIRYSVVQVDWPWLRQRQRWQQTQARPNYFAHYRDHFWLWPIPDQVYVLTLSYLKKLPALGGFTDTNEWMTEGEELIRSHTILRLLSHPSIMGSVEPIILQGWRDRVRDSLTELRVRSAGRIQDQVLNLDDTLNINATRYNINWQ